MAVYECNASFSQVAFTVEEINYGEISLLEPSERSVLAIMSVLMPSILPMILLVTSWQLWYIYNVNCRDQTCKLPLPPGSMGLPVIGETLNLVLMGAKFYKQRLKSYGNVFKTHILGNPTIRVVGAKNIRKILLGEHSLVTAYWPKSVRTLMGEGTVTHAMGDTHRHRRKVILKAFSHKALSSYVGAVQDVTRSYIQRWCQQGYVFGYPECKSMTFKTACRVLVGFKVSEKEHQQLLETFGEFMDSLFSLPFNVPGSGFNKGLNARHKLLSKIEECLQQRKEEGSGFDALSLMMGIDGEEKLTLEELKDVGLELLFAGHATCASAASSLLLHLAKNKHVVDRITEELRDHGLDEDDTELSLEKIGQLKYVSNVVKEVLRLAPPIGGGFRKALKTFEIDGYQIPKGWTVAFSIRETQELTEIFSESDKFNPDRWNSVSDDRFHYIPFGGGSRTCAGKELAKLMLKIFAIELARNCTWRLLNESSKMKYIPVPHPVDGLPVHFSQIPKNKRPRAFTW
ncbi:cytochrome P450 26A1-like [Haliotis rufescens]|uniref:cytochrome P450 26A1-like n=1 Tax=Haliotis rufescens TaxID=6454 RepID=UPI00201F830E|nr:cytochrome P450 26A1-like [Haliotis rufescens]